MDSTWILQEKDVPTGAISLDVRSNARLAPGMQRGLRCEQCRRSGGGDSDA